MISFRERPALVKRTVAERGYTAPVLLDESGDVTGKAYGVFGPPTAYFVDLPTIHRRLNHECLVRPALGLFHPVI